MPVTTPALFHTFAQQVLDCVCAALNLESDCNCPCRRAVVVGPPAWDNCCDDGQLTIHLERLYVHENFPFPASGPVFCLAPLAADYVVTLLRCAPVIKDDGTPPTSQELSDSAKQILTDMYITEQAIICCLAAKKRHQKFVMRESNTVGPDGGCVGFTIRFTTELMDPLI